MLTLRALTTRHVGPVDLTIAAGECVCIAGASGSGKTLLLRAVADLDPHGGQALLEDRAASAYRAADWRRAVGYLPAESPWWKDEVGAHFATIDEAAWARLGFAPETADWDPARCSTGERQRLALLRLLANRPRALLLDEPTASLDAASTEKVEALLADCRRAGTPLLWVSHDAAQAARVADRRFNLEGGRLRAETA